jgi:hypothetical protein
MCGRLRGCQEILMSKSNRCCGHVSGLFVSQVLATGPDEVRVSEAIQTRAIEIAVDSSVSSDLLKAAPVLDALYHEPFAR